MKLFVFLSLFGFSAHAQSTIECVSTTTPEVTLSQMAYNGHFLVNRDNGSQLELNPTPVINSTNAYESFGYIQGPDVSDMNWPVGSYKLVIPELPGKGTLTVEWNKDYTAVPLPSEYNCIIE